MSAVERVRDGLRRAPRMWLVTGAAGFVGSNLVEALLLLDQQVVGFDNFATGHRANLDEVRGAVAPAQWERFTLVDADIRDAAACAQACEGVDVVLHEAALGSIPRSLAQPLATHETNVTGLVNMLLAARDAGVARFVYASSSSVYGDSADPLRREDVLGQPLSPYAASKRAGELYAAAFAQSFGMTNIGLRYFNVFGPRQDPQGPYAAVIPRWADALLHGGEVVINGDGETSRDFCHIADVVNANLLAACTPLAGHQAFNVGTGRRANLLELFAALRAEAACHVPQAARCEPRLAPFRPGEVRHSVADIARARAALGYEPSVTLREGLERVLAGYAAKLAGER